MNKQVDNPIDHPEHYGGVDNTYEAIKVIEDWNLSFCLGNTIKYIARAGKKGTYTTVQDLEKARWYLDREIYKLRGILPRNGTKPFKEKGPY